MQVNLTTSIMKPNRLAAILSVVLFSILMVLYVREFSIFSNTLEVKALALGSILVGAGIAGAVVWILRARFMPWEEHFPTAVLILIFSMVFAPLFGSLLNRGLGHDDHQSFEFVAETAYFASGYGVLRGEKLKPTGWKLVVREGGQEWKLKNKTQAYFPITKPGEQVLLPLRRGFFGVRVVEIEL